MVYTNGEIMELWNEPALRGYLGEVRRKHGVVETLALPSLRDLPSVQIETLFVPPMLSTAPVHTDEDPEDWPEGKNLLSELSELGQLVVLGDPGGGKTTLSNWLAWRLTSGSSAPLPESLQNRIPFPCILRDMPKTCFESGFTVSDLAFATVVKLIGEGKAAPLEHIVRKWVNSGRYVLVLDGIDEIPVHRRSLISSWIREAHQQSAVVLATSRIVGYEDCPVDSDNSVGETEKGSLDTLMGSVRAASGKRRARNIEGLAKPDYIEKNKKWANIRFLMPFSQGQISDFARNWYSQRCVSNVEAKQKTSDFLGSLAQSDITQKLARTPNLLSLMAIVHRERAHLPDGKALLYEEIVNAYINTIDNQRRITAESNLSHYGWKDKKSWLAYVGFKLQSSRDWGSSTAGILASEDEIVSWLGEAISQSGIADYELVAREFLSWVARRSGLLLPRGENRYAFVHLSFQEYFCSCYLSDCIVRPAFVTGKMPADALVTREKIGSWAQFPEWLETFIFLFESLSAEHGFEWVDILVDVVFGSGSGELASLAARLIKNKHVKLPECTREFLASGCVTKIFNEAEYRAEPVSEIAKIMLDAGYAAVFTSDSDHTSKSPEEYASWAEKVRVLVVINGVKINAKTLSLFKNLEAISVRDTVIDLAGLERSEDISLLRFTSAAPESFQEIAFLKSLSTLELRDIKVLDLKPLMSLNELEVLDLSGVTITDLSPIKNLKSLRYLCLKDIEVSDLSPIGGLKKLKSLSITGVPIRDASFVRGLTNLDYVQLANLYLDSLECFAGCKKISTIDFSYVDLSDFSPVSNFKNLDHLFIAGVKDLDLNSVGRLNKLVVLMLEDLEVEDFSPLAKCKNLSHLFVRRVILNNPMSLSKLARISALSLIDIHSVKDISYINDFRSLRYLDISGCPIEDISVLESMSVPFALRLRNDHSYDLSALSVKDGFDVAVREADVEV